MKKALLILLLALFTSGLNGLLANVSDKSYDMLVNDILKASGSIGTAVVFNPKNMGILYIYNPKMAIGEAEEPGSIIKVLTSIVYLSDNAPFKYKTRGYFLVYPRDYSRPRRRISSRYARIRRGDFFPDGKICPRGEIDIIKALSFSSNSYFLAMSKKIKFAKWYDFLKKTGFGSKTGYQAFHNGKVISEDAGKAVFKTYFNRLMANIGLGPHFKVTPIQYAAFFASLFNGGKILKPVSKGEDRIVRHKYSLPSNMELIYSGLKDCIISGTGKGFTVPGALEVYAKTGSTMQQKRPWKPNGWFAAVLKLKDEKMLGIVVYVKNNTSRSAKYIASALLRDYVKKNNLLLR